MRMFSRKILLALGISASASAFAPAGPAMRVGASKVPAVKGSAAVRRPTAVRRKTDDRSSQPQAYMPGADYSR